MYVRPYVRPSTKSFFDFNEIWCVGKFVHFRRLSPPPFIMGLANDHGFLNYGTIPKACRGRIFIFILVFMSRGFEVGSK